MRKRPAKLSLYRIYTNCACRGECRIWNGTVSRPQGYPMVYDPSRYGVHKNQMVVGRRVVWELANGAPLPPKHVVIVTCGNVACLWRGHLQAVKKGTAPQSMTPRKHAALIANGRKRSALDEQKAAAIAASDEPTRVLMERYETSESSIQRARRGDSWRRTVLPNASVFNFTGSL